MLQSNKESIMSTITFSTVKAMNVIVNNFLIEKKKLIDAIIGCIVENVKNKKISNEGDLSKIYFERDILEKYDITADEISATFYEMFNSLVSTEITIEHPKQIAIISTSSAYFKEIVKAEEIADLSGQIEKKIIEAANKGKREILLDIELSNFIEIGEALKNHGYEVIGNTIHIPEPEPEPKEEYWCNN